MARATRGNRIRKCGCLCTMLDVRCTIWKFSARCAGAAKQERTGCDKAVRGRWRLAPPMYDVRRTTEADEVCLCTIFDVRCTIWIIARDARGRQSRSEWNVIKQRTDVIRKVRKGGGRRSLPMYDRGGWRRPCMMTHWHHPASEPCGRKLRFCPTCLTLS